MTGKLAGTAFGAALLALSTCGVAADLVEAYNQALKNDPTFKKAQADWLSAKQTLALARTGNGGVGTGLFPNLAIAGSYARVYESQSNSSGDNSDDFDSSLVNISLTQPIFNLATWQSISSARYVVRAATATYLASAQDLINRVAFNYFEVLRANDKLNLTLAQKKQFKHQLTTAEEKFKVGLIAITGVYDARASYDRSRADEIRDRNDLQDRLEDLRAITGNYYGTVLTLKSHIPLVVPKPDNVNEWVKVGLRQNYVIQADLNNLFASRENIKVAAAAFLPTLNATVSYDDSTAGSLSTPPSTLPTTNTTVQETQVGLSLNFPLLSGGFNIVNTRQARYNYLSASDQVQVDRSNVESNTRQAYLGIESSISEIGADQQSIVSARNKLEATKAGYIVGTRTMVNVLDSVTSLTQVQLAYADDRYNYVEGIFNLKQQAGTLSPQDIQRINHWLGKPVKLSLRQPDVRKVTHAQHKLPSVNTDLLALNDPMQTSPIVEREVKPLMTTQNADPAASEGLPRPTKTQTQPLVQQEKRQGNYAIQVYASYSKSAATLFLQDHKKHYPLYILTSDSGHKKRYHVLYGKYRLRSEAADALVNLHWSFSAYQPWIVDVDLLNRF